MSGLNTAVCYTWVWGIIEENRPLGYSGRGWHRLWSFILINISVCMFISVNIVHGWHVTCSCLVQTITKSVQLKWQYFIFWCPTCMVGTVRCSGNGHSEPQNQAKTFSWCKNPDLLFKRQKEIEYVHAYGCILMLLLIIHTLNWTVV